MRAETWPDGFSVKPAQAPPQLDLIPAAAEPAQPAVHVMPMWEPSPQPTVEAAATPGSTAAEPATTVRRSRRKVQTHPPAETVRRYADPFATGDDGANCLRCGYLVEPAREKLGLLTCASCG